MEQSETKLTCLVQSCSEGADIVTQVADYQTVCEYFHVSICPNHPYWNCSLQYTLLWIVQTHVSNLHAKHVEPTVLQSKRVHFLKPFKFYSKAILSSYLHMYTVQIIAICSYMACTASFSFSVYLSYLRITVLTSQKSCDVTDVHYDANKTAS